MSMTPPLLSVRNLSKSFQIQRGLLGRSVSRLQAVDGVSFDLFKGETLGLVGESGSGKSTLGRCLLRLMEADSGEVVFDGIHLSQLSAHEMRSMRKRMQIIFQDPYSSLNPRMTVKDILSEPLEIHGLYRERNLREKRIYELLDLCGLRRESIQKYPHEFSGGQRQRICIARALAVEPDFIVCDEPVSALDVSIQAQIINLLQDLQKDLGLTYLFIAHDLKVVEHISSRVAVMYFGKIVESADADELYRNPKHPYTQALLSSIPVLDPDAKHTKIVLPGDPPSPLSPPMGCSFHKRCIKAQAVCSEKRPNLDDLKVQGRVKPHLAACHFAK